MKINWKVRLKSKMFLTAMFSLLLLLAQQVGSLFGFDTTLYNTQITGIFNTILAISVLLGVVVDHTTEGMSDSDKAINYKKPGGDK